MTSLREIRDRIRSVANVEQITRTMEMVAASKLKRQEAKVHHSKRFIKEFRGILSHLMTSLPYAEHPLFKKREVGKIAVAILSGDRGLCGSYHAALFAEANRFLEKLPKEKVELILIGKKAIAAYAGKGCRIYQKRMQAEDNEEIATEWVKAFLTERFDELWIVYTDFISALSKEVKIEKLLPIEHVQEEGKNYNFILESDPEELFEQTLPWVLKATVGYALEASYAAEVSARAFSMKKATQNADEIFKQLVLDRNKIRQAAITTEMIEITQGA